MTESDAQAVARAAVAAAAASMPALLHRLGALSDPTRLQLLVAIHAAPGLPVKSLAEATDLAPNTVSQALATLHEAGLVDRERDGRLSRWRLRDPRAHDLLHWLGAPHTPLHPPHPDPAAPDVPSSA